MPAQKLKAFVLKLVSVSPNENRLRSHRNASEFLRLAAFALVLSLGGVVAQEPSPTPDQLRRGIWRAELTGGVYMVRLSAITSVSRHEYIVDGAARVTEVNIATSGSELARFYFIEPNTPKPPVAPAQRALNTIEGKAKEVSARVESDDLREKVVKSYPTTTHAHTVEYRIGDKETLNKLFKSIEDSWLSERSGSFKP